MNDIDNFDEDCTEDEELPMDGGSVGSQKSLFDPKDQQELDDIRAKRIALMNELSKPDKPIPDSTGDKIMLMQLLEGREKAVFQRTRLKIASKIEENGANLTAMVAAALLQTKIEKPTVSRPRELKLDSSLQHSNPVPGMMEIGVSNVRYEDVVPKRSE